MPSTTFSGQRGGSGVVHARGGTPTPPAPPLPGAAPPLPDLPPLFVAPPEAPTVPPLASPPVPLVLPPLPLPPPSAPLAPPPVPPAPPEPPADFPPEHPAARTKTVTKATLPKRGSRRFFMALRTKVQPRRTSRQHAPFKGAVDSGATSALGVQAGRVLTYQTPPRCRPAQRRPLHWPAPNHSLTHDIRPADHCRALRRRNGRPSLARTRATPGRNRPPKIGAAVGAALTDLAI